MDYGAFIDLGGVDGLLHVGEISWSRINKPADVLSVGDQVSARVLKIDLDKHRISLGMKQLQTHPWEAVAGKYNIGDRVTGSVSRIMEFGAFVELEPGIEGLIHISEMSWGKKLRIASDIVKPGETVEVIILGINSAERRIALGLKQALGDPWAEAPKKFPAGSVVEGPVVRIMKFGAFIQLAEGVDGMVHVSDITADRRIDSPHDLLKVGQTVKAQVLAVDTEKRQVRLGMKQLVPTGVDEYLAEHRVGDLVSGRLMEVSGTQARAELGEGIFANCRINEKFQASEELKPEAKADLSSLTSMLQARWKGGPSNTPEPVKAGQVRSFRITQIDAANKKIEVELA
jgi:small subunit ribosomal protein S1